MRWSKLIPTSLAGTAVLILTLAATIPGSARAAEADPTCGRNPGDDCESRCAGLCPDEATCCHWVHINWTWGS